MAYKVTNKYGNIFYTLETEAQRDEFIRRGFHEVPQENKKAVKTNTSTKRGKKNDKKEN